MTRKLTCPRLAVKVLSALFVLAAAVLFAAPAFAASTPSTTIVISQIYGAGGNSGSTYTADYVELFNLSQAPVTLTGWSLQYASATGTTTTGNIFNIPTVTIPAGGYYLISGAVGTNGTVTDPSDLQTTATLAAGAGRVYLVSNQTAVTSLSGTDATTVDFVGYGTTAATFFGTAPAPAPGTTTYDQRVNVCANTNQNGTDFAVGTVTIGTPSTSTSPGSSAPHNSTSPVTVCTHPAALSNPTATPSTVKAGTSTLLTVTVTPNASTGIALTANTAAFTGGSASQPLYDDGTHGDAVAGDHIYSFSLPVNAAQAQTSYSIAVSATDAAHNAITGVNIALTVGAHSSSAVTLTATPAAPTPNQSTLLTATIAPSNATGTVTFSNYGVTLNTIPAPVNSGVATYTVSGGFPAGDQQLAAVYSGDGTFNTSTGSLSIGVVAVPTADFSLGLSNAQVIGSAATPTANVSVYINAVGGFNSAITLSCLPSSLPANVSCSFSPQTITPNAGANGAFVSSVLTFTTSTSSNVKPHFNGKTGGLALAFTLLVAPFAFRKRRPAVRLMALLFVLFVGMQVLTGCGNGSVAAGTSTVTVTAAGGGTTHTGTITVITE
jgi:hypothetical protein